MLEASLRDSTAAHELHLDHMASLHAETSACADEEHVFTGLGQASRHAAAMSLLATAHALALADAQVYRRFAKQLFQDGNTLDHVHQNRCFCVFCVKTEAHVVTLDECLCFTRATSLPLHLSLSLSLPLSRVQGYRGEALDALSEERQAFAEERQAHTEERQAHAEHLATIEAKCLAEVAAAEARAVTAAAAAAASLAPVQAPSAAVGSEHGAQAAEGCASSSSSSSSSLAMVAAAAASQQQQASASQ